MDLAEPLGLFDIPVTRVSNYCASAGDAVRNACMGLLSGAHDCVLALGVEKLRDRSPQASLVAMQVETGHPYYQKGFTAAGTFAVFANRHFERFGTTRASRTSRPGSSPGSDSLRSCTRSRSRSRPCT